MKPRWCTCRPRMTEIRLVAIRNNSALHSHSSYTLEERILVHENSKVSSATGRKPCKIKWQVKSESRLHRLTAARLVDRNQFSAKKPPSWVTGRIAVNPRDRLVPRVCKGSWINCALMPSNQSRRQKTAKTNIWSMTNNEYKSVCLARMSLIYLRLDHVTASWMLLVFNEH